MTATIELPKARVWPVLAALVIAVAMWLGNLWYGYRLEGAEKGLFGDMFGAVNALFSGMAFVGVIYAISMQRHEIAIAKAEIKYTKTILDRQQDQLTLQNQETKKQAFESTYFQLVRLFTEITNQIDLQKMGKSGTMVTKGKDAFPVFLDRFRKAYAPGVHGGKGCKDCGELMTGVDTHAYRCLPCAVRTANAEMERLRGDRTMAAMSPQERAGIMKEIAVAFGI